MNAARTPDTETLSTRDRELVERENGPIERYLILRIDAIRTALGGHGGQFDDCVHCRIFRHINAAYGEAVGEPIEALLSTRKVK